MNRVGLERVSVHDFVVNTSVLPGEAYYRVVKAGEGGHSATVEEPEIAILVVKVLVQVDLTGRVLEDAATTTAGSFGRKAAGRSSASHRCLNAAAALHNVQHLKQEDL